MKTIREIDKTKYGEILDKIFLSDYFQLEKDLKSTTRSLSDTDAIREMCKQIGIDDLAAKNAFLSQIRNQKLAGNLLSYEKTVRSSIQKGLEEYSFYQKRSFPNEAVYKSGKAYCPKLHELDLLLLLVCYIPGYRLQVVPDETRAKYSARLFLDTGTQKERATTCKKLKEMII